MRFGMKGWGWTKIRIVTGVLLPLAVGFPASLTGQEGPFAFQIRGGVTRSLDDFRRADRGWEREVGNGPSLSMGFTFPFFRALGGYVGFSQYRFRCDDSVCPEGKDWVSTGFDLAARVVVGRAPYRLWLQGGLHTHRMEARVSREDGPANLKSEGGGGYEIGGGLLIRIGERTSLAPGVRYGLGNVPFDDRANLGPRFLVIDVGLVLGF